MAPQPITALVRAIYNRARLGDTLCIAIAVLLVAAISQAQTFQVIHEFTGPDGELPSWRLSIAAGGHLYGSTYAGGAYNLGTAFRMSPQGSNWTFDRILQFDPESEGNGPQAGLAIGPGGVLYGTTDNATTIYTLQPPFTAPRSVLQPWSVDFLYDFPIFTYPAGDLIFDSFGNIYGVTSTGGNGGCFLDRGCGAVYELSPSQGGWIKTTLYEFQGGADGEYPVGVSLETSGKLIGTSVNGGSSDMGVIFELTPTSNGWSESVIYNFSCSSDPGCMPQAGLTPDGNGNFYGSTSEEAGYTGSIFELSPANGGWTVTTLARLPQQYLLGPDAPLTLDSAGNIYGTIEGSTLTHGAVFKLTHGSGEWSFTSLHDFTGGSDGATPLSTVAIGANGKLFGTASQYGSPGGCECGTVWEITP